MSENEDTVRKGYDKLAAKYQTIRHTLDNKIELEEYANLLPPDAKILDVGCGT